MSRDLTEVVDRCGIREVLCNEYSKQPIGSLRPLSANSSPESDENGIENDFRAMSDHNDQFTALPEGVRQQAAADAPSSSSKPLDDSIDLFEGLGTKSPKNKKRKMDTATVLYEIESMKTEAKKKKLESDERFHQEELDFRKQTLQNDTDLRQQKVTLERQRMQNDVDSQRERQLGEERREERMQTFMTQLFAMMQRSDANNDEKR